MLRSTKIICIVVLMVVNCQAMVYAQTPSVNAKAKKILDKAIGDVFLSDNYAVYFEGISLGVKQPEDIFTLPVYRVYRGGHLFVNQDKYELNTGFMKGLSDGKLMVVIEENSKTMFVDSIRAGDVDSLGLLDNPEFNEMIADFFIEGDLQYQGEVTINKVKCHKIRSDVKNNSGGTHVIYWVNVKTGMLYLMAEYQKEAYVVYWIDRTDKSPDKFSYTIHLPSELLKDFNGYNVIDNRFNGGE